jgi:L-methionine (R)-S-oxide reductase
MRYRFDKKAAFDRLLETIKAVLGGPEGRDGKLRSICRLLREEVFYYDWVGFYLVDPAGEDELVLGPYEGEPTEHSRIPFGRGICGRAAESRETLVVPDVSKEANYLSCSAAVRSEMVVPIMRSGVLLGELDIDSHERGPFSAEDEDFLEKVCGLVAGIL